jgi:glutathione S-transferase
MILYENLLSPYAFKVRVLMTECGVGFESKPITTRSQRDELLAVNPRGEVPVLVDGSFVLADSPLICRYLAEQRGCGDCYPSEPAQRFSALTVERYSDTQLDAAVFVLLLVRQVLPSLAADVPNVDARCVALLDAVYDRLEQRLLASGGEYFVGALSIADLAVIPHVASARAFNHRLERSRWPALAAWTKRMFARPAVRDALVAMGQAYEASRSSPDPLFSAAHVHVRSERIEALHRVGLGHWLSDQLQAGSAFLSDP